MKSMCAAPGQPTSRLRSCGFQEILAYQIIRHWLTMGRFQSAGRRPPAVKSSTNCKRPRMGLPLLHCIPAGQQIINAPWLATVVIVTGSAPVMQAAVRPGPRIRRSSKWFMPRLGRARAPSTRFPMRHTRSRAGKPMIPVSVNLQAKLVWQAVRPAIGFRLRCRRVMLASRHRWRCLIRAAPVMAWPAWVSDCRAWASFRAAPKPGRRMASIVA